MWLGEKDRWSLLLFCKTRWRLVVPSELEERASIVVSSVGGSRFPLLMGGSFFLLKRSGTPADPSGEPLRAAEEVWEVDDGDVCLGTTDRQPLSFAGPNKALLSNRDKQPISSSQVPNRSS